MSDLPSAPAGHISYQVDAAGGLILETWSGVITRDVLLAHWRQYLADPAVLAIKRTLVDLRDCDVQFSGEEWLRLIESCVLNRPDIGGWKSAIVVDKPHLHGIARQFLGHAAQLAHGELFEQPDQAIAWLTRKVASDD